MATGLKAFDTLGGRKDLQCLLQTLDHGDARLGDRRRRSFLLHVAHKTGMGVGHRFTGRCSPVDAYVALTAVSAQFRLDLEALAVELEDWVRKRYRL